MFKIQSRYEYWSNYEGKKWTKWFNLVGETFNNKSDAEIALSKTKKKSDDIDKLTKLKHEFKILEV